LLVELIALLLALVALGVLKLATALTLLSTLLLALVAELVGLLRLPTHLFCLSPEVLVVGLTLDLLGPAERARRVRQGRVLLAVILQTPQAFAVVAVVGLRLSGKMEPLPQTVTVALGFPHLSRAPLLRGLAVVAVGVAVRLPAEGAPAELLLTGATER
jgi:hypothetical protein